MSEAGWGCGCPCRRQATCGSCVPGGCRRPAPAGTGTALATCWWQSRAAGRREGRAGREAGPAALNGEVSQLRGAPAVAWPPSPPPSPRLRPARWRQGRIPLGGASLPQAPVCLEASSPAPRLRPSGPVGSKWGGVGCPFWGCFEPRDSMEDVPAGAPPPAAADSACWIVPGEAWGVGGGTAPGIWGHLWSWTVALHEHHDCGL